MRKLLLSVVALLVLLGTGMDCGVQYTVLVDREEEMYLLPGSYTGFQNGLQAGDRIKAEFSVLESGGPVDFFVLSDDDLALWEAGQQYQAVLVVLNSTGGTRTGVVPTTGDYWILASNKADSTAGRKVFYEVWRAER